MNPINYFMEMLSPDRQELFRTYWNTGAKLQQATATQCDPKLQALPHPKRLKLSGIADMTLNIIREFAPACYAIAQDSHNTRTSFVLEMANRYPELTAIYAGNGEPHPLFGFDAGQLQEVAMRAFWDGCRGKIFETTDALEERLRHTDFGIDIPASWFRLPAPCMYLKFGNKPDPSLATLFHADSGIHAVEGCYLLEASNVMLNEETAMFHGIEPGNPVRVLDIAIYGSSIGKANGLLDDAFTHCVIIIANEERPIVDIMESWLQRSRERDIVRPDVNEQAFRPVLNHVAKILLYLGSASMRRRESNEESEARKGLQAIKSSSKIAKAERKLGRLYDKIIVGPDSFPGPAIGAVTSQGSMPMHWRRGYMRDQPYGPRGSLRRPVWIEPTLVRADLLNGGDLPPAKDYEVR